jgi:polyisoprenoid-binding protein YceI
MSVLTTTTTAGATPVVPAGTWTIDATHSSLEFAVRHAGVATVKGRATDLSGTITGGEDAAIEGIVPVAGLTTFDETRDGHLQSPDFFDADRFPELRFVSSAISLTGDDLVVEGELTLKGVTKPVTLTGRLHGPATDPWGNERIGVDLEGAIDRNEYGISWNAPLPGGGFLLPDTVRLSASFSAVKAA